MGKRRSRWPPCAQERCLSPVGAPMAIVCPVGSRWCRTLLPSLTTGQLLRHTNWLLPSAEVSAATLSTCDRQGECCHAARTKGHAVAHLLPATGTVRTTSDPASTAAEYWPFGERRLLSPCRRSSLWSWSPRTPYADSSTLCEGLSPLSCDCSHAGCNFSCGSSGWLP